MTNGYNEGDKDGLVFHSYAQHPFNTISHTKSALSSQKRGILAKKNLVFFLNRNRGHDRQSSNGFDGLEEDRPSQSKTYLVSVSLFR
jgi:hypothetical protein